LDEVGPSLFMPDFLDVLLWIAAYINAQQTYEAFAIH
jgi:hypothetical protein